MMQFHLLSSISLDNHPLRRILVKNLSTIQGNFFVDMYTKLRFSNLVILVQRHRQCPYDVRLYTSCDNLQLDITNEKSACMAINVAGNNKTYIGNHVMCPEILRYLSNFFNF